METREIDNHAKTDLQRINDENLKSTEKLIESSNLSAMAVADNQFNNVTTTDVINLVNNLMQKELQIPQYIAPPTGGFYYSSSTDDNFIDRNVFVSAADKCLKEAEELAKITDLIDRGKKFATMLYTWRSCTIPLPKNLPPEGNVVALEVLEIEMDKLKQFYNFQKEAVEKFRNEITRLTSPHNEFVSKTYFSTVGKFVSTLAALDELKNIKASIKNDYAYYKRVSEKVSKRPEISNEMRQISLFLATHNSILTEVKNMLAASTGHEDLFCNIINSCIAKFEQKNFLLPEEKYDIVKVTGFLTYLLDSAKFNINKCKKINLTKIDSMLKEVEVLPLLGDMMFRTFNYIKKTPNFDASHWPKCMSPDPSPQSSLVSMMSVYRQQHTSIVAEYTLALKSINPSSNKLIDHCKTSGDSDINKLSLDHATVAYNIAVKLLQTLSLWTSSIVELVCWKLTNPAELKSDRPGSSGSPPDATTYERVTKYNYSAEEKSALVELLGFIKGLQGLVKRDTLLISSLINSYIFAQLQQFVNVGLSEPLRKASKHHKDVVMQMLTAVQNICADVSSLIQKENDSKKSKKSDLPSVVAVPRQAPPSQTQLYLAQAMLEFLTDKTNSRSPYKDVDNQHIKVIKEFLAGSSSWNYVLKFEHSLEMSCDLSQLWYREFYLEMTKGEEIQFPIEQSLTWILISHILERKDPYLVHFVLYLFDLYNDSAQCALHKFKKQFLYNEIEAEALLCFEQLVYKLSEYVYEHHKVQAATIILNKQFGETCRKLGLKRSNINYLQLIMQTNIQLLGRSVDLKRRITQMMNDFLIKSLNVAITRFEYSDITGIIELETLIKVNRETHKLLSKYLSIDDFNSLWQEANHSVTSSYGRVCIYTLLELTSDFLPHYCYNSSTARFVHTILPFSDKNQRDKPPNSPACHLWGNKALSQCYSAIISRYSNFIGEPHFNALLELIGYQDVAMLARELLENNKSLIKNTLLPYLSSLQAAMPKKCILPRYDYTSSGVLGYYELQLAAILTYSDLQPKVFQCLREIGNSILFVMIIEQCQSIKESMELHAAAMFLKIIPKPFINAVGDDKSEEFQKDLEKAQLELENKYRHQHVYSVMSKNSTEEQLNLCKENILLTRDKLSSGLFIFRTFLLQIQSDLIQTDDPVFKSSSSPSLWCVEANAEFHRVWSAMQFVMCRSLGQNELTVEELFGEGINWAGCTLVFLLRQQHRFQLMDSCYHLHNVNRVDQIDKICAGVPLRKMVDRIRKFQNLNDVIFSILVKYFSPGFPFTTPDIGVEVDHIDPMINLQVLAATTTTESFV